MAAKMSISVLTAYSVTCNLLYQSSHSLARAHASKKERADENITHDPLQPVITQHHVAADVPGMYVCVRVDLPEPHGTGEEKMT